MKPTVFFWGWNDTPRQPDRLMTRERMATMMRSWRRAKRNPAHGTGHVNHIELLERTPGRRVYRVTHTASSERATIEIRRGTTP
jgi:hypothetical protein